MIPTIQSLDNKLNNMVVTSSSTVYNGTELGDMAPLVSEHFDPGKYIIFSSGRIYKMRRSDNVIFAGPILLGYSDGTPITLGYSITAYANITSSATLWLWNPSGNGSDVNTNVCAQDLALYSYYIGPN